MNHDIINGLVCSDPLCTQADRDSSLVNASSFINCIDSRNRDYANTHCGTQATEVFFCSKKEEGKFCSELINLNTEIPSACSSSNCTTDCEAALMERFGCCIHLNFSPNHYNIPNRLMELQGLCDFSSHDTCQLALPPLSAPVPQHKFVCPVDNRLSYSNFTDINHDLYCEIFRSNTQQMIDMALATSCSRAGGIYYYILCDRSLRDEWCTSLFNNTIVNQVQRQCSTEVTCSSECRKSLISLNESLGCCANTLLLLPEYNPSSVQFSFNHYYSCSDKMDIWSHCGVPSPGFCDNSLTSGGTSQSTGLEAYVIALIVVGAITLLALVLIVGAVVVIVVRRRRRSR